MPRGRPKKNGREGVPVQVYLDHALVDWLKRQREVTGAPLTVQIRKMVETAAGRPRKERAT